MKGEERSVLSPQLPPRQVVIEERLFEWPVADSQLLETAPVVDSEPDPEVLANVVLGEPERRAQDAHRPVRKAVLGQPVVAREALPKGSRHVQEGCHPGR